MKRKFLYLFVFLFLTFANAVKADLINHNTGDTGKLENLGKGEWSSTAVGLKVVVTDRMGKAVDSLIVLNNSSMSSQCKYFSASNHPKYEQSTSITWQSPAQKPPQVDRLPSSWKNSDEITINFSELLSDNEYELLMHILKKVDDGSLYDSLMPGGYIVVEPIAKIRNYCGTAFELANAFLNESDCSTTDTFCYRYAGPVFGGNNTSKYGAGGIFWNTIYLKEEVLSLNLHQDNNTGTQKYIDRHECLKSKNCGRGIGVFSNVFNGSLEITTIDSNTNNAISGAGFTLYNDSECKNAITDEQYTNDYGVLTFSDLATKTYYYKETTVPNGYIQNNTCYSIDVTNNETSHATVKNTLSTGTLKINIKIKGTNTLITSSNAQLEVVYDSNCNRSAGTQSHVTSMGVATENNLTPGNYSILELETPDGYSRLGSECVVPNVYVESNEVISVDIFYEPLCTTKLNNLGNNPTPQQLFNLYKEYSSYTNLLNLSNPSCSVNNNCDNSLSLGCLSGTMSSNNFHDGDLSCYQDALTDQYGNYIGFCRTTYGLTNNLGTNKFYAEAGRLLIAQNQDIITIFEKNAAGQLVEKVINNKFVASSVTTKTCYSLNSINTDDISIPQSHLYFGDNDADAQVDLLDKISAEPSVIEDNQNGLYKYIKMQTTDYLLNFIYLEKISGKYSSTETGVGVHGVLSRFDKESGEIPFKISVGTTTKQSSSCKFETQKMIINPELQLEFRLIDTNNPFNRKPNSNWDDGSNKSNSDNKLINDYILKATNSYGIKNGNYNNLETPKYKITLKPDDIRIIRKYNDNNQYDTYLTKSVKYGAQTVIRNSFLYSLEQGNLDDGYLSNKLINAKYPV